MSLYPGKKKKPEMIQVAGTNGDVQSLLEGQERIYSQPDTKKIISMARSAKSNKDLVELGRFICKATKAQDGRKPEYTS